MFSLQNFLGKKKEKVNLHPPDGAGSQVVGDRGCGKTSVMMRFIHDCFSPDYSKTFGPEVYHINIRQSNFSHLKKRLSIIFLELPKDELDSRCSFHLQQCNGIIHVVDLSNKDCLSSAERVRNLLTCEASYLFEGRTKGEEKEYDSEICCSTSSTPFIGPNYHSSLHVPIALMAHKSDSSRIDFGQLDKKMGPYYNIIEKSRAIEGKSCHKTIENLITVILEQESREMQRKSSGLVQWVVPECFVNQHVIDMYSSASSSEDELNSMSSRVFSQQDSLYNPLLSHSYSFGSASPMPIGSLTNHSLSSLSSSMPSPSLMTGSFSFSTPSSPVSSRGNSPPLLSSAASTPKSPSVSDKTPIRSDPEVFNSLLTEVSALKVRMKPIESQQFYDDFAAESEMIKAVIIEAMQQPLSSTVSRQESGNNRNLVSQVNSFCARWITFVEAFE